MSESVKAKFFRDYNYRDPEHPRRFTIAFKAGRTYPGPRAALRAAIADGAAEEIMRKPKVKGE